MNSYPDHEQSPDDGLTNAELAAFQAELEADDTSRFDTQQYLEDLQRRFQDSLDRAGYLPLSEDNTRARIVHDWFVGRLYEELADSNEENLHDYIQEAARRNLLSIMVREHYILKQIQISIVAAEGSMIDNGYDDDMATHSKAALYADLVIAYDLDPSDPILTVLNEMVPGREISPDDETLEPHYVNALERLANEPDRQAATLAEKTEAYNFLGIDIDDVSEDAINQRIAIDHMIFVMSKIDNKKANATANRQERLAAFARENGINALLAQKILQFVDEHRPLS